MTRIIEKLIVIFLLVLIVLLIRGPLIIESDRYEKMKSSRDAILETALSCGEALNVQAKETQGCTATVYTMGNAKEECDRLVEKAAEGLDTCMSNVEFFKELAAYNESNLDTCLYDLRVERGQRTDGN